MDRALAILISAALITGWIWIFGQTESAYVRGGMIAFSILGGCLVASHSHDEDDIHNDSGMM